MEQHSCTNNRTATSNQCRGTTALTGRQKAAQLVLEGDLAAAVTAAGAEGHGLELEVASSHRVSTAEAARKAAGGSDVGTRVLLVKGRGAAWVEVWPHGWPQLGVRLHGGTWEGVECKATGELWEEGADLLPPVLN